MIKKGFFKKFLIILLVANMVVACGPKYNKKTKERKVHIFAVRQLPLPPTYNRIRTVHLAQPLPSREDHPVSNKIINPVFQFEAMDSTLEEISIILANTIKYSAYCDPSIAQSPFSLVTLGTVDEIGAEIEREANIKVVVDHKLKEVRFLGY